MTTVATIKESGRGASQRDAVSSYGDAALLHRYTVYGGVNATLLSRVASEVFHAVF